MNKLLLSLFLFLLISCGTRNVYVSVERPARVNLSDYSKIIIGDFVDTYGRFDFYTQDILAQKINQTNRFELFAGVPIDQRTGNIAPNVLLLEGSIIENFADHTTEFIKNEMQKDSTIKKRFRLRISSTTKISFRLIDYNSGKIVYTTTLNYDDSYSTRYYDTYNPEPRKRNMIELSKLVLVNRFMKRILPYQTNQVAPFQFEGTEFDKAICLAKVGQWDSAIKKFHVLAKEADNPKTYARATFNMGLCYMYSYNFDKAKEKFKEAYEHHDKSLYIDEILLANKMETEYLEVLEQRGER